MIRFAGMTLLMLGACSAQPEALTNGTNQIEPVANVAEAPAPAPVATSTAVAASPVAQWLVGSWSAEKDCASDFIAHYNADGSLQYGEDSGSWSLTGDAVTETITERFAMESDAPEKLQKPETRTYTVARIDDGHGTITFKGRKVPIQRC
ncbi:MAG: hypothetical protein EOP62_10650 [Sphingomonadales bacterium]|nr:MAG: hypothetical protein EOP62_10650 [Sphingomonadales bacterium]